MADIAIRVEGLSKRYELGEIGAGTFWSSVSARLMRRRQTATDAERLRGRVLWALKDVSFEVPRGQVLGIIGRNGAGKSTLLKILSRITDPTEGRAVLRGRVASMLEVGTGFHGSLTGRQNVYLNGAFLGMSKKEIDAKYDQIVAFSEIGRFIDTPVKRYSSGMYVRLAFAVAAHLESEILIVDEVLTVGDAAFQKKCLGTMGAVAHGGRTILFVSHNMAAVNNLCTDCIWLDNGMVRMRGRSSQVVHRYLCEFGGGDLSSEVNLSNWPNRYGNGEARILAVRLLDDQERPTTVVYRTRPMSVEFDMECRSGHALHLSLSVVAESGEKLLHLAHHDTPGLRPGVLRGRHRVRFTIPSVPLCAGRCSLVIAIHTENLTPLDVVTDVLPFQAEDVEDSPRPYRTIAEYAFCWTDNRCSIVPLAKGGG